MIRARFLVDGNDPRPVEWPISHPYWVTGSTERQDSDRAVIVAYADSQSEILRLWPDAQELEAVDAKKYIFTDRFPRPRWFTNGNERCPLARHLAVGRGGWTIHFGRGHTLSHYGDTWKEHLHELAPDAVGTDTTGIDSDICTLALAGPMCDADLPAGTQQGIFGEPTPWADVPQEKRDPRFGTASALDHVAPDVYLTILARFPGYRIFNPHAAAAAEAQP